MKIPFFSKRTKEILERNEDRIFLMTKTQQTEILQDPNIKPEDKLYQLVKENNELKVLFDEMQDELAKELKAGGNYIIEISKHQVEIIPNVKVLQDNQIEYKGKRVEIDAKEKVIKMKSSFRLRQSRAWFTEPEGEYTYDPLDETPIDIKKRSESIIKVRTDMTKANFIQNILKGLKGIKSWYDYIPWIMFGVTLIVLGIGMFYWLNGYELIAKQVVEQPQPQTQSLIQKLISLLNRRF